MIKADPATKRKFKKKDIRTITRATVTSSSPVITHLVGTLCRIAGQESLQPNGLPEKEDDVVSAFIFGAPERP